MKIFLSGAMSCQSYSEMNSWRKKIKTKLSDKASKQDINIKVYNPVDFYGVEEKSKNPNEAMDFDLDLVLSSDLIVVNTKDILRSPGTICECLLAWKKGIPVLGFGEEPHHPWVKRLFRRVDETMDGLVDYIDEYYFVLE